MRVWHGEGVGGGGGGGGWWNAVGLRWVVVGGEGGRGGLVGWWVHGGHGAWVVGLGRGSGLQFGVPDTRWHGWHGGGDGCVTRPRGP